MIAGSATVEFHRYDVTVSLVGELDESAAAEVRSGLSTAVHDGQDRRVVVDLARATRLCDEGLQALIDGYLEARATSVPVRVVGAYGDVDRVLRTTGLHDMFREEPRLGPAPPVQRVIVP